MIQVTRAARRSKVDPIVRFRPILKLWEHVFSFNVEIIFFALNPPKKNRKKYPRPITSVIATFSSLWDNPGLNYDL